MKLNSLAEMILACNKNGLSLSQLTLMNEAEAGDMPEPAIESEMRRRLLIMKESAAAGVRLTERSPSGLSGGDANRLTNHLSSGGLMNSPFTAMACAYAMAVAEINAGMGKIVAAPTAGSCGILPGVLISAQDIFSFSDDKLISGLLCASGVGMVIAARATLAGAEGGCQAECGSASAMAAAALCELMGGTPEQCGHAVAMALKFIMGLVCDPVAGLVEAPCVKRNGSGAVLAITAADMALAGIESVIPADEVIDAMRAVGASLPEALRETAEGGIAATPAGRAAARCVIDTRH